MAEPAVLDCDQSYYKRRGTAGEPEYRRHLGRAGVLSTDVLGGTAFNNCSTECYHTGSPPWLLACMVQAVAWVSDPAAIGAITATSKRCSRLALRLPGFCQRRCACDAACSDSMTAILPRAYCNLPGSVPAPSCILKVLSGLAGPPASTLKPEGKRMVPVPRGEGTKLQGTRQFPERKVQTPGKLLPTLFLGGARHLVSCFICLF